jgi:hypothetical protein
MITWQPPSVAISWVVTVLGVTLVGVIATEAFAARLEIPAPLVGEARDYGQQAADADGSARQALTTHLYAWIGESARTTPLEQVVAALARGLRVKRDDPKWTWRDRAALLEAPPATERVTLLVAQRHEGDRAVAVFTALFVAGAEGSAKLFSAPSLVVTQKGKKTRTQTLGEDDDPRTPALRSVLAFVRSDAALPDILLGWCVVGSGDGLKLKQFHPGNGANARWDVVWSEEFVDVINFTFDTRTREASIRWQDGVGATVPYEAYVSVVKLTSGRAAVEAPPMGPVK